MASRRSFLPSADLQLRQWLINFANQLSLRGAALGFTTAQTEAVGQLISAFDTAYDDHIIAQEAARSARVTKDDARDAVVEAVRAAVRQIQASPACTDTIRADFRITVPDEERTAPPPPETRPIGSVDFSQRLRHTLRLADQSEPTRRSKPEGVATAEIWLKIGDEAGGPADYRLLDKTTETRFTAEYPETEGNKTAHYLLRWVNSRGEKGPWSETVSATIAA